MENKQKGDRVIEHPKRRAIHELAEDLDLDGIMFFNGFDDEILGMTEGLSQVCYSKRRILLKLMTESDMQYEDAIDYFEFNILGLYVGVGTPIIIDDTMIE